MDFLDFLARDNYIAYNKVLAHKIGIMPTILLMDLISKHKYFEAHDKLDSEWYFYNSIDNVEKDTALTRKHQDTALKKLIDLSLVKKVKKGMPATRYFKIYINNVQWLFFIEEDKQSLDWAGELEWPKGANSNDPNGQTSMPQKGKHDCPKGAGNKNNIYRFFSLTHLISRSNVSAYKIWAHTNNCAQESYCK